MKTASDTEEGYAVRRRHRLVTLRGIAARSMGRNWPTLDEMREVLGGVLSPVWGELQIVQGGVQYLGLGAEQAIAREETSASRALWRERERLRSSERAARAEYERFWQNQRREHRRHRLVNQSRQWA